MIASGTRWVVIIAAGLALTACGQETDDNAEAEGLSGDLDVWIMEPGVDEAHEFFDDLVERFENEHPDTNIEITFVPWAEGFSQYVTAIGAGQVPDLGELGTTWTPGFAEMGSLLAVDEDLRGDELESLLETATVEGSVYGFPWYAGSRSLVYRADILNDLGLEAPETWDELVEIGREIQENTEMHPFGVFGETLAVNNTALPLVWQWGGELAVQEEDGSWRSAMDSEEAIGAIDFWASLYRDEQFAPQGAIAWSALDALQGFELGDIAMVIATGANLNSILQNAPELEDNIGVSVAPAGPAGGREMLAGGSNLAVFQESDQQDLAVAFARFMIEPDNANAFADAVGFLPGTTSGLEASAQRDDPLFGPLVEQLLNHSRAFPPTPAWSDMEGDDLFITYIQSVMTGERDAEEAMQELAEEMNEAFGSSG